MLNMRDTFAVRIYSVSSKVAQGTTPFHIILLQRFRYDYILTWGDGQIYPLFRSTNTYFIYKLVLLPGR